MMYGEELHVHAGAQIPATAMTAIVMEAATGNILTRQMFLPGMVLYWGYKPVTENFLYDAGIAVQGYLGLYRNTKTILPTTTLLAGGTLYAVGDLFTIVLAPGTGGKGRVTAVTAGGVVSGFEIVTPGILYPAGACTTVALNGSGANDLTLTIVTKKLLDTIALANGSKIGKQYMRRVPNAIGDASPAGAPPASYNAGEDLLIDIVVMAVSTGQTETGEFQPILVTQNRGENFAAQPMWVEGTIGVAVSPAVPNY